MCHHDREKLAEWTKLRETQEEEEPLADVDDDERDAEREPVTPSADD
jgi:hypothetical protein